MKSTEFRIEQISYACKSSTKLAKNLNHLVCITFVSFLKSNFNNSSGWCKKKNQSLKKENNFIGLYEIVSVFMRSRALRKLLKGRNKMNNRTYSWIWLAFNSVSCIWYHSVWLWGFLKTSEISSLSHSHSHSLILFEFCSNSFFLWSRCESCKRIKKMVMRFDFP